MHAAAVLGVYCYPLWSRPRQTTFLCFVSWQLAVFGITIGYHRLYSHRSFTATRALRVVLALMGCLGFQGSIKCEFTPRNLQLVCDAIDLDASFRAKHRSATGWCTRHRLHVGHVPCVTDNFPAVRVLLYFLTSFLFILVAQVH